VPSLSETEEFEFRLRAEQESAAPPKPNLPNGAVQDPIGAANRAAAREEHGPVEDVMSMVGAIPGGIKQGAEGVANVVQHPIQAGKALASRVGDVIRHPIDTAKGAVKSLPTMTPEQVGTGIGSGLVGGAAGKAAGVLGDVAGPAVKELIGAKPVSQTIRDLAAKDVVTTPGMRGGKIASAVEQRLSSVPVAGDVIKRARGKTTEQWNKADLNEAISDAGGTPVPKNRTGRDAIFHTEQEMGKAYSRVLPQMKGDLLSTDPATHMTFRQALEQVKRSPRLNAKSAKEVNGILNDEVIGKFVQGRADGKTIKEIQETLRTEADEHRNGGYQERKVAQALDLAREQLSSMLKRENPKLAAELENVDRGYAKFKTSSKASTYAKKGLGVYTPAQKLRAIHARERSKDKQRYASGTAKGQKETEAVESVIGNTEPDSGSAGRIATMEGALGLGGLVTGHPLIAGAAAATPLIYSQPVLKALQNRALKKGGAYKPISGKKAATVGAILGAQDEQR